MPKIHHLFVIDPIEQLNLKLDSSLRMARSLCHLGHMIYVCSPNQLEWHSDEACASAWAKELAFPSEELADIQLAPSRRLRLDFFQAIHMRKDPPYDMAYINCTWLLSSAQARGVRIYNDPQALRDFNEKMGIFQYPQAIRKGLISANPESLFAFLADSAQGDAILKPLTLYGGRGVLRLQLEANNRDSLQALLREETQNGLEARLIQAFDSRIFQGEVRAFSAFGKALSFCLKRPPEGQYLANTRSGAVIEAYEPSPAELHMVESLAKDLWQKGVAFVGFDIIGSYVSEINITSPRLLQAATDPRDYYREIADLIQKDLR